MATTEPNLTPLETIAPDSFLLDTRLDKTLSLANVRGKQATVIMFICNRCLYVEHIKHEQCWI
ncbi:MAG: hypothetical protein AAF944_14200 [Bacteroidota bacterium]